MERVFPVEQLTSGLSRVEGLEAGKVAQSGSLTGDGQLDLGDWVEVEIVCIGRLANMVSRAQGAFLGYHPMIYYETEGERNEAVRHHC